jgi:hypothetical protein
MLERLLSKRPEQEKRLLELIVDKLGDPDSNVAAKTLHLLNQLCNKKKNLSIKSFSIYFSSGTTSGNESRGC